MPSSAFKSAAAGQAVLVSETNVERLQLVGRIGTSTFLMGGSRDEGQMRSGPNPYDLLGASLAACTAMTIRLYAERKSMALDRVQVSVSYRRGAAGERDAFERSIVIEGNLEQQQSDRLVEIANLCPIGKTLGQGADIHTTLGSVPGEISVATPKADYERDVAELSIPNVEW